MGKLELPAGVAEHRIPVPVENQGERATVTSYYLPPQRLIGCPRIPTHTP